MSERDEREGEVREVAAGRRRRTDGPGGCWARWVTPLVLLLFFFSFPRTLFRAAAVVADLIHSTHGTATTTAQKLIMN